MKYSFQAALDRYLEFDFIHTTNLDYYGRKEQQ